jgi:hypothetical protein
MGTSDNSTAAWSNEVKKSNLQIDYFYGWMDKIEERGWNIGKEKYVVGSSVYKLLCDNGISDYKGLPIEVDWSIHEAMIRVI